MRQRRFAHPRAIVGRLHARGHYDFGAIDWAEFWRVVGGHGPCNKERLAARVKAWDDGAWVRDAALAHARKQATKQEAA